MKILLFVILKVNRYNVLFIVLYIVQVYNILYKIVSVKYKRKGEWI